MEGKRKKRKENVKEREDKEKIKSNRKMKEK